MLEPYFGGISLGSDELWKEVSSMAKWDCLLVVYKASNSV